VSTWLQARQELSNHKDLVKLQAVIRGHLVRRQAAESLQCLLAIVKTQGLVRAHQTQQVSEGFWLIYFQFMTILAITCIACLWDKHHGTNVTQ
jgi:hypothetical protein